ncbi:hypothetical protein [Mucilaginibacter terrae]|uniref:Alpha-1,2-fucosyltransferase n=1 Tax=Mucilaginibacter terrae TaxID=1955052 RepID=A0ABU3H0F8_9SPHI|nr:hypothetical protein [Mucilaginibacter terrae]MDT3405171.1 hypothetical protein [Mucilaginibacter terrae]
MIIVSSKEGQLCNRLFHFSSFIANAIEYKYKLVYPCFDEYEPFFAATSVDNFNGLPISVNILKGGIYNNLIVKYLNKINHKLPFGLVYHDIKDYDERNEIFHLDDPGFQQLVHSKIVIAHGWLYRDENNLRKHKEAIKKLFAPVTIYKNEACEVIANAGAECVIGVHIRRGDYKDFSGGSFYYDDLVYYKRMLELATLMDAMSKQYRFIICSNEKLDMASFGNLPINFEQRHFVTDLYTLAACDYIIGPPSTFSLWASYYGDVPLFMMKNREDEILSLADFKIY